jgi:hypothetical protein
MKALSGILAAGWRMRFTSDKRFRLIGLKTNRDLPYLNEQFVAGRLVPVIDGPYPLKQGADALRHFGSGNHKGKVVITMDGERPT